MATSGFNPGESNVSDPTGMEVKFPSPMADGACVHGGGDIDGTGLLGGTSAGRGNDNGTFETNGGMSIDGVPLDTYAAYDQGNYHYADGAAITDTETETEDGGRSLRGAGACNGVGNRRNHFKTAPTTSKIHNNDGGGVTGGLTFGVSATADLEKGIAKAKARQYKEISTQFQGVLDQITNAAKQAMADINDILEVSAEVENVFVRTQHSQEREATRQAEMEPECSEATAASFFGKLAGT